MADFNIVALGPPGSGKTVFLAVLHDAIASGQLAPGVRISLGMTSTAWLESVYRQVADPQAEWPPGTSPYEPMREIEMRFTVHRKRRSLFSTSYEPTVYNALTISYVDYAGEWLTEAHNHDPKLVDELQSRISRAHVLLCFLDGFRLLEAMQGDNRERAQLDRALTRSIRLANEHVCPTIVVLTKWDLLSPHATLDDVVTYLTNPARTELHQLVQARSSMQLLTKRMLGGVWLIPVSATGSRFATLGADGHVRKTGHGKLEPGNLSVPLTMGLVDVAELGLKEYGRYRLRSGAGPRQGLRGRLADPTGEPAELRLGPDGVSVNLDTALAFAGELGSTIAGPATFTARRLRRIVRRLRARGLDGVASNEGALMYLARGLRDRREEFLRDPDYAAARLWGDEGNWRQL